MPKAKTVKSNPKARCLGINSYSDGFVAWSIWDGCREAFIVREVDYDQCASLLTLLLDRKGIDYSHVKVWIGCSYPDQPMPLDWH